MNEAGTISGRVHGPYSLYPRDAVIALLSPQQLQASRTPRRMTLSRVTLAGLEQMGMTGRREDNVRMLTEEIAILEWFVRKYPGKADTLSAVIERYRALLRPFVS